MAGCSITLLKLDDELVRLWDAPVQHSGAALGSMSRDPRSCRPSPRLDAWVRRFADLITEQRAYLTELDSAIGDADHGINMDRGMHAVRDKLDSARPAQPTSSSSPSA